MGRLADLAENRPLEQVTAAARVADRCLNRPQLDGGPSRITEECAGTGDCALGNRAGVAKLGEFNAFRPMIVRCQALTPGKPSKHLHSTHPRTRQARFVEFRTAAVCALSRGPSSRSVSRNLRWSSDGRSRGLCRFA